MPDKSDLTQEETLRYSRHLLLPEVGVEGQRKLKESSVLLVGTGGLGSAIAIYLAAAGVGHIGLVDYDVVDVSNLQRQVVHGTSRLGQPKVESARDRLHDINPLIQIDIYNTALNSQNAWEVSDGYDVLVDGTDNFPTRYLLNDLAVFSHRPYVYGSVFRFEGQVSLFDARSGPCYRCLFPEPPPPGSVPSCGEAGVFGVLPGTIGTLQATETIKYLLGLGEPMTGRLLLYDALEMSFETMRISKREDCPVCGSQPSITQLIDYEEFCGVPIDDRVFVAKDPRWTISATELAQRLSEDTQIELVDVREPHELEISRIPGAKLIPLNTLPAHLSELDGSKTIVVFCRTGTRAARALDLLRSAGFQNVLVLDGGVNAWVQEVDPSMPVY
jgi:adenylyltransferase/sulfurtransferase